MTRRRRRVVEPVDVGEEEHALRPRRLRHARRIRVERLHLVAVIRMQRRKRRRIARADLHDHAALHARVGEDFRSIRRSVRGEAGETEKREEGEVRGFHSGVE